MHRHKRDGYPICCNSSTVGCNALVILRTEYLHVCDGVSYPPESESCPKTFSDWLIITQDLGKFSSIKWPESCKDPSYRYLHVTYHQAPLRSTDSKMPSPQQPTRLKQRYGSMLLGCLASRCLISFYITDTYTPKDQLK